MKRSLAALGLALTLAGSLRADDESRRQGLAHGGRERTYLLHEHAPVGTATRPIVLVLHGGRGTAEGTEKLTRGGWNRLADRHGLVVAYPEGIDKHWNDGRQDVNDRAHREGVDDVGFLSKLIDHLVAKHQGDPGRVYLTGISNGGFMSSRAGRELSAKVTAIAPVAGTLPLEIAANASATAPARPVSVLAIHGDKDDLVPYQGGDVKVLGVRRGKSVGAEAAARLWVVWNGCARRSEVRLEPDLDPEDGTRLWRETWTGGREGTEVQLLKVEGGGHTWPGGWQYLPALVIGRTSRDLDANEEIWRFFERHRR